MVADLASGGSRTGSRSAAPAWFDARVERAFDALVAEAVEVSVDGWDFSWLDGRATEERPSWGYQRRLSQALAAASAALDIQTGGGEVLAGAAATVPSTLVATEGWPPNVAKAAARLHPLGAVVVAVPEDAPLPFAGGAFDLVTSRHPATVHWSEIARVLTPGGTYFAQHVGGGTNVEIREHFLGPVDDGGDGRHHDVEARQATAAGLEIVQCRNERLQLEFFDVGAMVFFLRKVIWTVPDFTVDRYRDRLRALHDQIERDGVFRSTMSRTLFEVRKPTVVG
jgi:SAM-dependent methyltransferase